MSTKYPGGFITKNPVAPSLAAASGIWSLDQAEQNIKANTWPLAPTILSRSLRFRSSASAYMNRTPATTTNQTTFTWSGWVKRGAIGSGVYNTLFYAGGSSTYWFSFRFGADSLNLIATNSGGGVIIEVTTPAVFRDPSSWYHVVLKIDSTQATAANRVIIYVNNVQQSLTVATQIAQNQVTSVNTNVIHTIGQLNYATTNYFDGYMAEVNFIDGQALTPSYFGAYDGTTGVWQPAHYNGTYGTNGFYLPFTNTTSTTTLGYDSSGNGNNWTPNNISLTAGSTYDSMTDVPTLTSSTAANYCTLNSVNASTYATLTNGNLKIRSSASGTNSFAIGTIAVPASKIYFEATAGDNTGAVVIVSLGLYAITSSGGNSYTGLFDGCRCINGDFEYVINGNQTSLGGGGVTAGTVIGMAYDLVSNVMSIYRNGTAVLTNQALGTAKTAIMAHVYRDTTNDVGWELNFGQQPFAYSAPSGYVALNAYNIPASTVPNGAAYMAATLATGNNSTQTITNTVGSTSFQPDFVWMKIRSAAENHIAYDSVRGVQNYLVPNLTLAEGTSSQGLTSFNSNGFTLGNINPNYTGSPTFVAWQWKAGGAAVSNTSGSITSSVSANTTSGFSVVTYTGTGANATIGHGLGVAPSMIIVKSRSATGDWPFYHTFLGNGSNLLLNTSAASSSSSTIWNATSPTSSVFSVGINTTSNTITVTYVAYCFAAIKGFSAFGSYTGNGSADGPFVYTGFRPRWVLLKRTDAAADWHLHDTSRDPYNSSNTILLPDSSSADLVNTVFALDILSNGFKLRTTDGSTNASGSPFIYAAFAENPFQNALAR